jgi:uncharacterized membrane protein YhaH (DUF805 family)
MDWQKLFLSAEGRIGRREFWIGFVIVFAASLVVNMIPVLGAVIGLLLIWPQICIHAKRLHDMDKSGWLMLIPFGVTILCVGLAAVIGGAGFIGAMALSSADADTVAAGASIAAAMLAGGFVLLAMLVGLGFLLWVGLTPTYPGPTRFDVGEEPDGEEPDFESWRDSDAEDEPPAPPPPTPPPTGGPIVQ